MIDKLAAFSRKYQGLRPFAYLLSAAACLVFGYLVLWQPASGKDHYLLPVVLLILWSTMLALMLGFFPGLPDKPSSNSGLFQKLKVRTIRAIFHLGAWVFTGLIVVMLWLSLRQVNLVSFLTSHECCQQLVMVVPINNIKPTPNANKEIECCQNGNFK